MASYWNDEGNPHIAVVAAIMATILTIGCLLAAEKIPNLVCGMKPQCASAPAYRGRRNSENPMASRVFQSHV